MNRLLLLLFFGLMGLTVFAQTDPGQIAPGAEGQLNTLLNTPAQIRPSVVKALGKNWYSMEVDVHAITDAGFEQVAAVLHDIENQGPILSGKKSRLTSTIVNRLADETIVDCVMTAFAPLGIQIKTPYRAAFRITQNTEVKTRIELRQTADDSASNGDMKNLAATRYAEKITINGTTYTYIRLHSTEEVDGKLPGTRRLLENNAAPGNIEALELIIAAAKQRN